MMLIEQLRVEAEEFKTTARDLEEANRPPSKVGQLYTALHDIKGACPKSLWKN